MRSSACVAAASLACATPSSASPPPPLASPSPSPSLSSSSSPSSPAERDAPWRTAAAVAIRVGAVVGLSPAGVDALERHRPDLVAPEVAAAAQVVGLAGVADLVGGCVAGIVALQEARE